MIPESYAKRSFLKFDIGLDLDALQQEVAALPAELWMSSYWGDVHCSVGTVLLRGGRAGDATDYHADRVRDSELLSVLPCARALISKFGPFGRVVYAFLFRMRPNGVTLVHRDRMDAWVDKYRIHVPVTTNDGAYMVADGRSQHFEAGYAWSFDNQSRHGFVNGAEYRTHLICDVAFTDALATLIDGSEYLAGERHVEHLRAIMSGERGGASYPGDGAMLARLREWKTRGLSMEAMADALNAEGTPGRREGASWDASAIAAMLANADP